MGMLRMNEGDGDRGAGVVAIVTLCCFGVSMMMCSKAIGGKYYGIERELPAVWGDSRLRPILWYSKRGR